MGREDRRREEMKAVLMSIRPKWCEKIASGEKTVEVRKTVPGLKTPFKCYIYCTKDKLLTKSHCDGKICVASKKFKTALEKAGNITFSGKVIGEFVCDSINYLNGYWLNGEDNLQETTCLDDAEIMDYIEYINKTFCLWHISDLNIYDKPKELRDFRPWCEKSRKTEDNLEMCCNCKSAFFDADGAFFECGLSRPPQSWCYVEEL